MQNPRGKVACFAFFHSFQASVPLKLRHLPGLLGLPVRCCRRRDLLVLACGVSLRLTKGLSQRNRHKEMGEMSGRLKCQLHCQMHCRDLNILTVDTLTFFLQFKTIMAELEFCYTQHGDSMYSPNIIQYLSESSNKLWFSRETASLQRSSASVLPLLEHHPD